MRNSPNWIDTRPLQEALRVLKKSELSENNRKTHFVTAFARYTLALPVNEFSRLTPISQTAYEFRRNNDVNHKHCKYLWQNVLLLILWEGILKRSKQERTKKKQTQALNKYRVD